MKRMMIASLLAAVVVLICLCWPNCDMRATEFPWKLTGEESADFLARNKEYLDTYQKQVNHLEKAIETGRVKKAFFLEAYTISCLSGHVRFQGFELFIDRQENGPNPEWHQVNFSDGLELLICDVLEDETLNEKDRSVRTGPTVFVMAWFDGEKWTEGFRYGADHLTGEDRDAERFRLLLKTLTAQAPTATLNCKINSLFHLSESK